ncbi:MAG TPA: sugar nucleotide-binding protein [Gaiellaceae bacterium]|nr:sugar nucleotide-binding protein [Gaiellaceae bacterium]
MQRLLVTGGCGYLGRELVARAAARGWAVRATWFDQPPVADAEWVRLDVRDADAVRAAADGVDAVVHTAYRQYRDAVDVNARGSEVVAAATAPKRLVHLSTDIVFRGDRGRYREEDEPDPVNEYGRSKAEAERRVAAVHPDATIVRTSLMYGRAEPGPQERLARENRRFFVDELRSPVQVGDLAEATLELLGLDVSGPLHVGGADDVSRFDFAVLLGADESQLERAETTPDRAPNVTLDSSRAQALLKTRLRGVHEVLG